MWNASIQLTFFVARLVSAWPSVPTSDPPVTEFPYSFWSPVCSVVGIFGRFRTQRVLFPRTAGDSCMHRSLPSPHEGSSAPRVAGLSFTRLATESTGYLVSLSKERVTITLRINPASVSLAPSFTTVSLADKVTGCGCNDSVYTLVVSKTLSKGSDLCKTHILVNRFLQDLIRKPGTESII